MQFAGAPGIVTDTHPTEIEKVFLKFDDTLLNAIHVDPNTKSPKFWMKSLLEMIPDPPNSEEKANDAHLSPRDLLIKASKEKDLEAVKGLLAGTDVNSAAQFGSLPLFLVSEYGFLEGVHWLHQNAGAFLNQADENGELATHLAALG